MKGVEKEEPSAAVSRPDNGGLAANPIRGLSKGPSFATLAGMGMLYYGDNLDILRRYVKDETVDLVYLDPPFNSAQNYNAFFQERDSSVAATDETFKKAPESKKKHGEQSALGL